MKFDKEDTNIGAHAVLVSDKGHIILQKRDDIPGLINPGLISMFGGTIKSGENLITGLKRELKEELKLNISKKLAKKLGTYIKTKEVDGVDWVINVFIVTQVKPQELTVLEGKSIVFTSLEKALKNSKLTRITRLAIEDFAKKIG